MCSCCLLRKDFKQLKTQGKSTCVRVKHGRMADTNGPEFFVGYVTLQQHASWSENCTCCHSEIHVAHQIFYLTQSQYTYTGQTSPGADPVNPGSRQGSHWSINFKVIGKTRHGKTSTLKAETNTTLESDDSTTRPTRRNI